MGLIDPTLRPGRVFIKKHGAYPLAHPFRTKGLSGLLFSPSVAIPTPEPLHKITLFASPTMTHNKPVIKPFLVGKADFTGYKE
jgi:hypothetical protein